MRSPARRIGAVVACSLALGACSSTPPPAAPATPEAARVGAVGSACELPVSFGLADSWKPKPVQIEKDDVLAELTRRGPLTMACEIDAKPAGSIGFLRVWTGAQGDLRTTLTSFIGKRAQDAVFTDLEIGGRPGLEVAYRQKNQLDDEIEPERAFVLAAGDGIVGVSLDSFDAGEHEDMLPAYELARSTLEVTS